MRRKFLWALLSVGATVVPVFSVEHLNEEIAPLIEQCASETAANTTFSITGEKRTAPVLSEKFYRQRHFMPAWLNEEGELTADAREVINAFLQSDREGLNPPDYHVVAIQNLIGKIELADDKDVEQLAELDQLLTDAFLSYGSHLLSGRLNPYEVDNDWFAVRRTGDLPAILEVGLDNGEIRKTLRDLLPTHPIYARMRDALAKYRTLSKREEWPTIPKGPALQLGDRDPRVVLIRERLALEGDLKQKPHQKPLFDPPLERAVIAFQKRYGLYPDGVIGASTFAALNVPVQKRVRQIRVNMERCRWLPANLGRRYIFVNVPDFKLQIFENETEVMDMKVVVGRKLRQTPVFSSTMTYLVLNPTWSVPKNVARMDMIDHILEEPNYLAKNGFEVFSGYEDNAMPIDPSIVDWKSIDPQNLTFKFRQKPGPNNALGQIKFMFPNRFDVYLHDTPSRSLFEKTVRDFSSGCIRIQKPMDLADYLLRDDPTWTSEKISKLLQKPVEQHILLTNPIPVHLVYLTAWVDERNKIQFREDIYGRDTPLEEAFEGWIEKP